MEINTYMKKVRVIGEEVFNGMQLNPLILGESYLMEVNEEVVSLGKVTKLLSDTEFETELGVFDIETKYYE